MRGAFQAVARRRALALTLLSLVLWSGWTLMHDAGHPYGDLSRGVYTDHFSLMNTARLFTHAGLDIWRKPLRASGTPLTEEEKKALPEDIRLSALGGGEVFKIPGWPADKPFISSWSKAPRFHPPGNLLLTAPVAALYSYTPMSFTWANKLLIVLLLIYAHVSLYLLFQSGLTLDRLKPLGFLVLFLAYGEVIHWTLEGFSEAAAIAPLILCGRYLSQRRGAHALAAFSIAANIHFRSYFFAPLAIFAFALILRDKQWKTWKANEYMIAAASVMLCAVSLTAFLLTWPWIRGIPNINSFNITVRPVNGAAILTLTVVIAIVAAVCAYARSWHDVVIVGWFFFMALLLRETYPWDVVTLMAWMALPVLNDRARSLILVRDVRIAAFAFFAIYVFHSTTVLAPTWLERVFTRAT